jgi:hypothetical protein
MYPLRTADFEASLWERIAIELYPLGALSIVNERFAMTRELAAQRSHASTSYGSWLRQGQVAGARAASYDENVLDVPADHPRAASQVRRDVAAEVPETTDVDDVRVWE